MELPDPQTATGQYVKEVISQWCATPKCPTKTFIRRNSVVILGHFLIWLYGPLTLLWITEVTVVKARHMGVHIIYFKDSSAWHDLKSC